MKNIIIILLILSTFDLSAKADTIKVSEVEKYTLFIKSFGLAYYFTPHQKYKTEDWENFLLHSIYELNQIKDTKNSLKTINNLYKKINIPVQIDTIENKILEEKNTKKVDTYYWKHTGLGLGKDKLPNITKIVTSGYKSDIEILKNSSVKYENIHLIGKYYCYFPLYSNQIAELKKLEFENNTEFSKRDSNFALLAYVWNLYNYFYPYSSDLQIPWDKLLQEAIGSILNNEKIDDVLNKLNLALNDAHSYIAIDSKNKGLTFVKRNYYPINFEYLDNKVVVSSISEDYHTTVNIGNILTSVNDKKINTIISSLIETHSGKKETSIHSVVEGWSKLGFLNSLFHNLPSDSLKLTFTDRQGLQKEIMISKTANIYDKYSNQILVVDGYYYINAGELNYKEFKKIYKSIEQSKGIVFDLRSHPTYSFTRILSHFTKTDLVLDNLFTPVVISPIKEDISYKKIIGFTIKSSKKQINLPVVFITGPGLYSYGESCIHLIKKGKLGVTIGENTGGCNGDMNFSRVFNTTIAWTGKKVLNNEGKVFQGLGYKPDIYFNFKTEHADKKLLMKDILNKIKNTPNIVY